MRGWSMCLVPMAVSVVALPLAAQQHGDMQPPPAEHRMHMQACMAMTAHPGPAMLLRVQKALGLSPAQVAQIRQLQQQSANATREHMREAMEAHQHAEQLLRSDAPDMTALEAAAKLAAEHTALAHVAMIRAGVEARKVLTAEQRQKLQTGMAMMHEMMSPQPMDSAGPGGRRGMMPPGGMQRMRVEITREPGMDRTGMTTMMGGSGMGMMGCMPMPGMM